LRRLGLLWQVCSDLAAVAKCAVVEREERDYERSTTKLQDLDAIPLSPEEEHVAMVFDGFRSQVEKLNLNEIWTLRPLLDGNAIMKELQIPGGKGLKDLLQKQIEWQLEHPDEGKDECLAWLRTQKVDR